MPKFAVAKYSNFFALENQIRFTEYACYIFLIP